LAYTSLVRSELHFALFGWTASYRLHFGYTRPCVPSDVAACSAWAAALDIPSVPLGTALGALRAQPSTFDSVVSTEIAGPSTLQHLLLVSDAVRNGGDDIEPVLSSGQSVQVEWIVQKTGRGLNGRTYFPYWGGTAWDEGSTDHINGLTLDAVVFTCRQWLLRVPEQTGGELVVRSRQRFGSPTDPLDSNAVHDVLARRTTFAHQRRRVEWRRPFRPFIIGSP
jgi:hypothetical protein